MANSILELAEPKGEAAQQTELFGPAGSAITAAWGTETLFDFSELVKLAISQTRLTYTPAAITAAWWLFGPSGHELGRHFCGIDFDTACDLAGFKCTETARDLIAQGQRNRLKKMGLDFLTQLAHAWRSTGQNEPDSINGLIFLMGQEVNKNV